MINFIILVASIVGTFAKCKCPTPFLTPNITHDEAMNPHQHYNMEWWYYLLNLVNPSSKEEYAFVTYFIKTNTDCDGKDTYFNTIHISSPNMNEQISFNETIYSPNYLNLNISGSTIERYYNNTKTKFTRFMDDFFPFELAVGDFGSFQLQGQDLNGYVPGSFDPTCYGAYSESVLRGFVTGVMGLEMNTKDLEVVIGYGYGEHVMTSMFSKNKFIDPSVGWICHYLHWGNDSTLQLCQGSVNIEETKHGMLKIGNEYSWLTYMDYQFFCTQKWKKYEVGFDIYLDKYKIFAKTKPSWLNQEMKMMNNNVWVGQVEGTIYVQGIEYELLGFTEYVNVNIQ